MRTSLRFVTLVFAAMVGLGLGGLGVARARGPAEVANPPAAASTPAPDAAPVASPVVVTTRVTPNPSSVGDLLSYEVTASFSREVSVNLPSVLAFEPLHFVSVDEGEPEPTGEGLRKVFTIRLQRFEVGETEIPSFALTYVDAQGQVQTVDVPPQPFEVEALLANEVDPTRRGEDPPVSLEYPNNRAEIIAYSVLAGLVLALLGLLLWRRIAARKKPVYVPPPIPAHEVALSALDELEHGSLLEQGEFVDYYLQLTEIAKGYLQGRFGVGALDRTTEEIRSELLRNPKAIEPLSADEMVAFLQRCDLVKFARFEPAKDEAKEQTGDVRSIVERTMVKTGSKTSDDAKVPSSDAAAQPAQPEDDAPPGGPR